LIEYIFIDRMCWFLAPFPDLFEYPYHFIYWLRIIWNKIQFKPFLKKFYCTFIANNGFTIGSFFIDFQA